MNKKIKKDTPYQDAVEELANIVDRIEEEAMDIDQLSEEVNRALALINHCRTKLRRTEESIQQAFEQNEQDDD